MIELTPDNVFQALYDEELNFGVECFWDGGFDVSLGDEMNGYEESTNVRTWSEVPLCLIDLAVKYYPGVFQSQPEE